MTAFLLATRHTTHPLFPSTYNNVPGFANYLQDDGNTISFHFAIEMIHGGGTAHIALATEGVTPFSNHIPGPNPNDGHYEIGLGAGNSWVRKVGCWPNSDELNGEVPYSNPRYNGYPEGVDPDAFECARWQNQNAGSHSWPDGVASTFEDCNLLEFWVEYNRSSGLVLFGIGRENRVNTVLNWTDPRPYHVTEIWVDGYKDLHDAFYHDICPDGVEDSDPQSVCDDHCQATDACQDSPPSDQASYCQNMGRHCYRDTDGHPNCHMEQYSMLKEWCRVTCCMCQRDTSQVQTCAAPVTTTVAPTTPAPTTVTPTSPAPTSPGPTTSPVTSAPVTPGPTAAPVTLVPAAPDATATPTMAPTTPGPTMAPVTSAPVSSAPTALTTNPSSAPTPIPIVNTPQDCGQRHLDCTDGQVVTMGFPVRCSDSPPNPLARCICSGRFICSDTDRPGRCSDNTVCRIRTASPSMGPTSNPTSTPTEFPTAHACDDGSHGCDSTHYGICEQLGNAEAGHRCRCAPTHHCSDGDCTTPGHTCEWNTMLPTAAPTSEPTRHPTQSPTRNPSRNPTTAPTSSPSTPPSAGPTSSPSASPTTTYMQLTQEREYNGGRGFGHVTDAELYQQRQANAALGRGTISNAEAEFMYPPTQPTTVAGSSTTGRPRNAAGADASSSSDDDGDSGVIAIGAVVVVTIVIIAVAYLYTKKQLGKAAGVERTGFDNPMYTQQQFDGDRSGRAVYSDAQGSTVGYMDVPATSSTGYLDVQASLPPQGHHPSANNMAMATSGYADVVAPGYADDEEEEV